MKTALVVLNGTYKEIKGLDFASYNHIFATDGAANALFEKEIFPDVIVGDLDSLSENTFQKAIDFHKDVFGFYDQDKNDLEKALRHLREIKCSQVDLISYEGNRLDHILTTLHVAVHYSQYMRIRLISPNSIGYIVTDHDDFVLDGKEGYTCSILPVGSAEHVTLKGFQWNLDHVNMNGGLPVSISNVIEDAHATVSCENGALLVYLLNDKNYNQLISGDRICLTR